MRRVAVVVVGIVCALGFSATSFQATPLAPPTLDEISVGDNWTNSSVVR